MSAARAAWIKARLSDSEPEARRTAVRALGEVAVDGAVELLAIALADDDWRVRKEATAVAPLLRPRDEVLGALREALSDTENVGRRNAAVTALVALGPDATATLEEAYDRLDEGGRKLAIEALAGIPTAAAAEVLVTALSDPDPNVRIAAAEAIPFVVLSPAVRDRARAVLVGACDSPVSQEVVAAAFALAGMGGEIDDAVLESLAQRPEAEAQVVSLLSERDDATAIPLLVRALGSAPGVAKAALVGLGTRLQAGGTLKVAWPPRALELARQLFDDSGEWPERRAAICVIGAFGSRSDVDRFFVALSIEELAPSALRGLALGGAHLAREVAARALDLTKEPSVLAALLSAPLFDEEAAFDVARAALRHEEPRVVVAALEAIAKSKSFTPSLVFDELVAKVDDPNDAVGAAAEEVIFTIAREHPELASVALSRLQGERAFGAAAVALTRARGAPDASVPPYLSRVLARGNPRARRAAVLALSEVKGDKAADDIAFATTDEARVVRLAAVRALGVVGAHERLEAIAADSRDPDLAVAALTALRECVPARAASIAKGLIANPTGAIAAAAVTMLRELAPDERGHMLALALAHPDLAVVKLAMTELTSGASDLAPCLDHPEFEVVCLASEILAGREESASRALVEARLHREADPLARRTLAAVLERARRRDSEEPPSRRHLPEED